MNDSVHATKHFIQKKIQHGSYVPNITKSIFITVSQANTTVISHMIEKKRWMSSLDKVLKVCGLSVRLSDNNNYTY